MRPRIESFRDLEVWQVAIELAISCYHSTQGFPAVERYGLISQIQRNAVSVPSNIAEGNGRLARNEYVQFLRYAHASLRELETQLIISERLGYLSSDAFASLMDYVKRCTVMLHRLMKSLALSPRRKARPS